jgi:hypothetical protein
MGMVGRREGEQLSQLQGQVKRVWLPGVSLQEPVLMIAGASFLLFCFFGDTGV